MNASRTSSQDGLELKLTEGLVRVVAVLALVGALALVIGAPGLGAKLPGWLPGSAGSSAIIERTDLTGAAAQASVSAANAAISQRAGQSRATASGPTEVTIELTEVSGAQRWAWVLVRALPALAVAVGLWLLAGLVRSVRDGDPFTRTNVRRLTWITVAVFAAGLSGDWAATFVRRWLLDSSGARDLVPTDFTMSFAFVGVALLLAVITAVWRRGVALRDDLEGLV